jgi:hypothetical protein
VMSHKSELLADLRAAFANVDRSPDAELFLPRDDYLWSESLHGGTGPWWDVPFEAIAHEPHALDQLTITGFQFFLPSYLSWVVSSCSDSGTIDTTISALDPSDCSEPLSKARIARFRSLTPAQRAAVTSFLVWAARDEQLDAKAVASQALSAYWARAAGDA